MAQKEDNFGSCTSESTMTSNPDHSWTQQQARPLWSLKTENLPLSEAGHRSKEDAGEDSSRKSSSVIDDMEDESGLELCLGLSLGGPVSKPKARNGQKDGGIGTEQRGGGCIDKMSEEISSRKLTRRDSDGNISRTQAFWQEFDISRDNNQQDEKPSHIISDVHLRERHPSSVSSISSPISSLSSLALPDTWRAVENSSGVEESKAAAAHPFWSKHGKPSQPEQGSGKEEMPIFQSLSAPHFHSAGASKPAWARYGQSGVAMPLLDGFKDPAEENPRGPFPVSTKDCKVATASATGDGGEGGQLQQPKGIGDTHSSDDILLTSDPRHAQESMEQQRKQKKQEARKRRKAFMEEQKMQKKAKKEDECRVLPGPTPKQTGCRSGTPPPGSKMAPPPQQANAREVSSPPDSQELGSASSGFRRTSSGLWSRPGVTWDGSATGSSPEKTPEKETLDQSNEDGNHLLDIRRALQRERDKVTKEKVWDVDKEKESESRQDSERRSPAEGGFGQAFKGDETNGSLPAGAGHSHENPAAAPASGTEMNKLQTDATWVQRMLESQMSNQSAYQMAATLLENKDQFLKGLRDFNGIQRKGPENASSAFDRERLKDFGPSVAEQAEKSSERSRFEPRNSDGKLETGNRSNAVLAGGSHPASGSIMTYSHPSNFPLVHMAYPFPVAGPSGLHFPVSYHHSFPYMMQIAPSADSSSAQERTGAPTLPSSFPGASSHPPYPVVGDVPAHSWTPVVRQQTTPPHSPPRTLVRSSSGITEEDNRNSQGAKNSENVRSVSPAKDASTAVAGHTLIRTTSLGSGQGQGGAFARLRPTPNLPPTPQFGPLRTRSDAGEAIMYRDGNSVAGNTAFASLVAAVEASQGLSAAVASVNTSIKQPTTQRTGGGAKLERTSSRVLAESVEEIISASSNSKASSQQQGDTHHGDSVSRTSSNIEEAKVTHGNRFQQGTTSSLSEGLISQMGQEGSCLKVGCASGQMFGGSGSSPDLPWVTCKGAGPNGKAISGVLYKYNKGQVRIVCACHGRHMSPSEFVQHAGSEDLSNPEKSIVVNPFPHGSQAASAQG